MKALITGASSGIGRDIAVVLSKKGYDLILVARNKKKLEYLKTKLKTNIKIISMDLSIEKNCFLLYDSVKYEKIDILINNAGYGVFGEFCKTDLKTELNMIDLNIKAVHILTKLFLKDFKKRNAGRILNVASSAAFLAGPLMASYYASKAYVLRLTQAIYEELKKEKSAVYVGVLCPGPVETNFNERANVNFSIKGLKSREVAHYAVKKMMEGQLVIIPGLTMKAAYFAEKLTPEKLLLKIAYHMQRKKEKENFKN